MYMQYDVTIGIPVYKSVDYIDRTINSALCQTYPSIEFLILDDCGNDGSMEIVEKYKDEHPRGVDIHIIHNDSNLGVGLSRNRILNEAQGLYLLFLDSDDILEPDAVDLFISAMNKKDLDVVYGSWLRNDIINNELSTSSYPYLELLEPNALALYALKNYSSFRISVCNCLIKMSFIKSVNIQFIDTPFWEDLVFTYEMIIKVKRAILLPNITYRYICREGSLSHYQNRPIIPKQEILNNVASILYLKKKCHALENMEYLPFMCYNLGMNSFYVICNILKNKNKILPKIEKSEICSILYYPKSLCVVLKFRNKLFPNLFFWGLALIPSSFSILIIRIVKLMKM